MDVGIGPRYYGNVTIYELDDLWCIKANTGGMRWARQRSLGSSFSTLPAQPLYEDKYERMRLWCPYASKRFMGPDLDQLAGGAYVLSSYKFKVQFKATR
jgi:hypothetical protein